MEDEEDDLPKEQSYDDTQTPTENCVNIICIQYVIKSIFYIMLTSVRGMIPMSWSLIRGSGGGA